MSEFKGIKVIFRYGNIIIMDDGWKGYSFVLPNIGHRVYLGNLGKYFWYKVKSIDWITSDDVFIFLTDKSDS